MHGHARPTPRYGKWVLSVGEVTDSGSSHDDDSTIWVRRVLDDSWILETAAMMEWVVLTQRGWNTADAIDDADDHCATGNGQEEEPTKWLHDAAWDIYKLIREFGAMERFREMVKWCCAKRESQEAEYEEYKRCRAKHFTETAARAPKLRCQEADPPDPSWSWETDGDIVEGEQGRGEFRHYEAWTPPDLSEKRRDMLKPKPLLPLPDRRLTLPEKYAVLAVVHDHVCKCMEKIDPWPDPPVHIGSSEDRTYFWAQRVYQDGVNQGVLALQI